jgi:hypothetical protein
MDTLIKSGASNGQLVTGLFPDRDSAERAYSGITERGYAKDDVNVVMSDDTRHRYFSTTAGKETELGNKAAEGAGVGGAIGGTVVGIAAAVAAIGSNLILPGLGLVIAGPLAAGVAGIGAGALSGGIIGALVGWAMPEERVKNYEEGIKKGGILMGVRANNAEDAAHFESSWREGNGQHVYR